MSELMEEDEGLKTTFDALDTISEHNEPVLPEEDLSPMIAFHVSPVRGHLLRVATTPIESFDTQAVESTIPTSASCSNIMEEKAEVCEDHAGPGKKQELKM